MARPPKSELAIGSVVAVPVGAATWAIGQVWFPGIVFYLAMSCTPHREPLSSSLISDDTEFTIFSWTNAAEILRGRWRNFGPAPLPLSKVGIPNYKCLYDGKLRVWTSDGSRLRDYDETQDRALDYKTSRSPLLIEDAIKAQNGLLEWPPHLRRMLRP